MITFLQQIDNLSRPILLVLLIAAFTLVGMLICRESSRPTSRTLCASGSRRQFDDAEPKP